MFSYIKTYPVNIENAPDPIFWDDLCDWMDDEIGEMNWNFEWKSVVDGDGVVYFNTEEDKVKFILRWL